MSIIADTGVIYAFYDGSDSQVGCAPSFWCARGQCPIALVPKPGRVRDIFSSRTQDDGTLPSIRVRAAKRRGANPTKAKR